MPGKCVSVMFLEGKYSSISSDILEYRIFTSPNIGVGLQNTMLFTLENSLWSYLTQAHSTIVLWGNAQRGHFQTDSGVKEQHLLLFMCCMCFIMSCDNVKYLWLPHIQSSLPYTNNKAEGPARRKKTHSASAIFKFLFVYKVKIAISYSPSFNE